MHSPHPTGEQFARSLHSLSDGEPVALPPHEPIGEFVLQVLGGQPDSPLLSARVNFTGTDPTSGEHILGYFDASNKPLAETLTFMPINKDTPTLQ